jgi:hypothetical protein
VFIGQEHIPDFLSKFFVVMFEDNGFKPFLLQLVLERFETVPYVFCRLCFVG